MDINEKENGWLASYKNEAKPIPKENHYFSLIPTLAGDFLFTCLYMKLLDVSQGWNKCQNQLMQQKRHCMVEVKDFKVVELQGSSTFI